MGSPISSHTDGELVSASFSYRCKPAHSIFSTILMARPPSPRTNNDVRGHNPPIIVVSTLFVPGMNIKPPYSITRANQPTEFPTYVLFEFDVYRSVSFNVYSCILGRLIVSIITRGRFTKVCNIEDDFTVNIYLSIKPFFKRDSSLLFGGYADFIMLRLS